MQITIIGAGIAGLSAYLFLSKHLAEASLGPHTIQIYETYQVQQDKNDGSDADSSTKHRSDGSTFMPQKIGGAIGIGKNGLAVLGRIDGGEVLRQMKQRGNCVSFWRMGTARGWKIVDAVVASSSGENGQEESQPTVMISRQVVWEILRNKVLAISPEAITTARVAELIPAQNGKMTIKFGDGSESVADLVIGADGLKSVVRGTMFEQKNEVEPQSWWERLLGRTPHVKDYTTPHFEGLTGVGGVLPGEVLEQAGFKHGVMAITFGPNGFFGHGYISPDKKASDIPSQMGNPPLAGWWSTFSSPTPYPFLKKSSSDVTLQDTKTSIDNEATLQNLCARHRSWQDPVIQAILDYICEKDDVVQTYPTFTTPELPTWHKDNLVLIGDAAHALQPSSGQGACQALEDSEALALLLSRYMSAPGVKQDEAIARALNTFTELRKPRLAKIYEQSSKFGKMKADMNVVQEFLMYFFIWFMHKLGAFKKYNDELFKYDLPTEVDRLVKQ